MTIFTRVKNSFVFRLKWYFKHFGRKSKIHSTVASRLNIGEIDLLELLEICRNSSYQVNSIYDIGAHIGVWTILAKSIFPNSEITCFEPLPQHLSKLTTNTSKLDHVHIYSTALGSKTGEITINIANQSDSSSIMELTSQQSQVFGVIKDHTETIHIAKLDEFVRQHNIPSPDLMKLDIQGYELEVLKSGIECMRTCKFIILEVSFLEFYAGQPLFEEVIAFMASQQYKAIALGYNTATGYRIKQCDILFENKTF